MTKAIKNYAMAFLVIALMLVLSVFFVGCNNNDNKKQIEELQEQLSNSIYVVNLTKETASNVQVRKDFEFLIQIKDNSSFTYFDSENSITFKVYKILEGSWVVYDEPQYTTNTYITFGADIYKIQITNIDNATNANISILQTATQRTED